MEGCSKYCTFCVVPYTRGEEVSRPLDDVLAEIAHLAGQGVREVNLLGQNVNAYRGRNHLGEITDFAELLHLVAAVEGIGRIRYTTSHPLEFSDALVQAYADIPALVSHVHLPVQSGSDRILAAMKRDHTALEYKSTIRKLRARAPGHQHLLGFHRRLPRRDGKGLRGHHAPDRRRGLRPLVQLRLQRAPRHAGRRVARRNARGAQEAAPALLQARINQQAFEISRRMVGRIERVLVTEVSKRDPGRLQGRTENNRLTHFSSDDTGLIGQFVDVEITEALPNSLRASGPRRSALSVGIRRLVPADALSP